MSTQPNVNVDSIPYATVVAPAPAKAKRSWLSIIVAVVVLGPIVTMVGIVVLLACVAAIGSSAQDEFQASTGIEHSAEVSTVSYQPLVQASAEGPTITYQGEPFVLKYVGSSDESGELNEYIPVGETQENWTKMIAVRRQPIAIEPIDAARGVVEYLQEQDADTPFTIWPSDDGESCGVDFAVVDGEVAELNVFLYHRSTDGENMVCYQYAERAYGDDRLSFVEGLEHRVHDVSKQVFQFDFPELIESN
mgnify:CR=1 FL=1